jgi:hypothetical protein
VSNKVEKWRTEKESKGRERGGDVHGNEKATPGKNECGVRENKRKSRVANAVLAAGCKSKTKPCWHAQNQQ